MITRIMVPYDADVRLSDELRQLGSTVVLKEIDGEMFRVITIPNGTVNRDLQILERTDQQTGVTRSLMEGVPLVRPTEFINPVYADTKFAYQDTHQKTYWQKFNSKAYGNRRKKSK